ncbi:MAG: glycosyltransferase family 39 protein, partial [Cucumibacter sp.]
FHLWARRVAPDNRRGYFWLAVAVYLASPGIFSFTSIVFPDYLLLILLTLSGYWFAGYLADFDGGKTPGAAWLYLAAIALGLATLAKYNAALFGLGIAVLIVLHPRYRGLLRNPHLYLAALVAIGVQAPVVYWNLSHGAASFAYHFSGRWGGIDFGDIELNWLPLALASWFHFLFLAPLVAAFAMIGRGRGSVSEFAQASRRLALATLGTSTLVTVGFSLFERVLSYWNIAAFPMIYPLVPAFIRSRWIVAVHFVFGPGLAVALAINYALMPVALFWGQRDWESSIMHGWDQVAAEAAVLREQYRPDFLASTRYSLAAQFAFALQEPSAVTDLAGRPSQFDYWSDPGIRRGANALILDVEGFELGDRAAQFDRVELLREIEVTRFGYHVTRFRLYLGYGYRGGKGVAPR